MMARITKAEKGFFLSFPKQLTKSMGWKIGDTLMIKIKGRELQICKEGMEK